MTTDGAIPLNDLSFDEFVQARGTVLVDFTSAWCRPCRLQGPILARFAAENPQVAVAVVDVDESPALATRFGVRGVPMLVALRAGQETARKLGLTQPSGLAALMHAAG